MHNTAIKCNNSKRAASRWEFYEAVIKSGMNILFGIIDCISGGWRAGLGTGTRRHCSRVKHHYQQYVFPYPYPVFDERTLRMVAANFGVDAE